MELYSRRWLALAKSGDLKAKELIDQGKEDDDTQFEPLCT